MIGGLGSDLITAGAYLDGGGIGEEEQVLGDGIGEDGVKAFKYDSKIDAILEVQ